MADTTDKAPLPPVKNPPLGFGLLINKRAELAGEIKAAENKLEQMRSDMLHLDATIRLLDPAYKVDAIVPKQRRPARDWFGNGELLRMILETLRKAPEPLTAKEVALGVMERKGFDVNDGMTLRLVEKRVFSALDRRKGSLIEAVAYGPRATGWKVAGS